MFAVVALVASTQIICGLQVPVELCEAWVKGLWLRQIRMIVSATLQLKMQGIRKCVQTHNMAYQFFKTRTIAAILIRDTCTIADYVVISHMATGLRVGRIVTGDDDTLVSAL